MYTWHPNSLSRHMDYAGDMVGIIYSMDAYKYTYIRAYVMHSNIAVQFMHMS